MGCVRICSTGILHWYYYYYYYYLPLVTTIKWRRWCCWLVSQTLPLPPPSSRYPPPTRIDRSNGHWIEPKKHSQPKNSWSLQSNDDNTRSSASSSYLPRVGSFFFRLRITPHRCIPRHRLDADELLTVHPYTIRPVVFDLWWLIPPVLGFRPKNLAFFYPIRSDDSCIVLYNIYDIYIYP